MVEDSLILTIKLKDEVSGKVKDISTSLGNIENKVNSINKLALANTLTLMFKNMFDMVEKTNNAFIKYEKQVVQVQDQEIRLKELKEKLTKVQEELNRTHDTKLQEKYKQLVEEIRIQEQKLLIEKKELFSAQLNLTTSFIQLGTTTIPNLIASISSLSTSIGALRNVLNLTFVSSPWSLALIGVGGAILALNEALGFLPFKISDAFKPFSSEVPKATTQLDDLSISLKDVVDDLVKVEEKAKSIGEIKIEFNKDLGIEDLGGELFKNVMSDAKRRMLINNPMYFINEMLESDEFVKIMGLVRSGIIPMRTLEANMLQTIKQLGLPKGLEDDVRLKIQIALKEKLNNLSDETNKNIDEQASIYKKLNDEVLSVNKSLDSFINKVITLRNEIARLEDEIRSRPQPLSITITPSGGGGGASSISPMPSKPPSLNTIDNIGGRSVVKHFTSGMYVY